MEREATSQRNCDDRWSRTIMRVIVTGLVGQYAFGGVAWDYLQYVEGFRQLGHDVFYLEDTETWRIPS